MEALAKVLTHSDPIEELICRLRGDRWWVLPALLIAAVAHGVVVWHLPGAIRTRDLPVRHIQTAIVDIDTTPPPSPPPKPAPTVHEVQPLGATRQVPVAVAPIHAQAAAVLTRQSETNEPVDMTDGFVVGTADTYAGGTTASQGTSSRVVHDVGQPGGPMKAKSANAGTLVAATWPDRARAPSMTGTTEWRCPFPSEADAEGANHAVATLRIIVDVRGLPTGVLVLRDPGHGFGREARRCALEKHFEPALDHAGIPIEGKVTLNVHFDR